MRADDHRMSHLLDSSQFDSGQSYMKHKIFKSDIPGLQGHYLWKVTCPERTTSYDYVSYEAAIRMRGCCKANSKKEFPELNCLPTKRVALSKDATAYLRSTRWGSG